jgi:hypothetical protein
MKIGAPVTSPKNSGVPVKIFLPVTACSYHGLAGATAGLMTPKNSKDNEQIGRVGEAGLFLVPDRTLPWKWESLPRWVERNQGYEVA